MSYMMSVINDMFSMFDAGVTVEEIYENSIWSLSMISAVHDMWEAERGENNG